MPASEGGEPESEEVAEDGGQSVPATELDETPEAIPIIETQETDQYELLPDNQLGMESTPGHDSGDDKDKDHLRRSVALNQIELIESDDDNDDQVKAGLNGNFKNKTPKKNIAIHWPSFTK